MSAGATGTYDDHRVDPGVTEVQAGSYVLMDRFHEPLSVGVRVRALRRATAISVHGDLVVFDAGRKASAATSARRRRRTAGGEFAFIHEEHLGFRYPGGAPYRVGDRAALVPAYAPTTVNLFGAFHVVEDGPDRRRWLVLARHGDT